MAGVSATTASHALNESRRVLPATRQRVLDAAATLGYRPNILARSLRRKQTGTLGLLLSDIELPYFTEVARAVETAAFDRGYNVVLCNTDESLEKEVLYTEVLLGKRVDGLLIAPTPGGHEHLRAHVARGARIVFFNRFVEGLDVPAVVCDDFDAIYRLTTRLVADGHRRIGAVLGLPGVSTTERRLAGFRQALLDAGEDPDAAWVAPGGARLEGGIEAAALLAAAPCPPTALVAFNSSMLDGVLVGLRRMAPQLLESVEVSGYGISVLSRALGVSRHGLEAPTREIGRVATNLLLDRLADGSPWRSEIVMLKAPLLEMEVRGFGGRSPTTVSALASAR